MSIQKTKAAPTPSVASPIQSGNSQAKAQAEKLQQVLAPALENRKLSEITDKKERLLELANIIERAELVKHDIGFNMSGWVIRDRINLGESELFRGGHFDRSGHKCGSTGCIAGWAVLHEDDGDIAKTKRNGDDSVARRASALLQLTPAQARELFFGEGLANLYEVAPAHAVAVIRNLAETGKVQWTTFDNDGKKIT